VNYTEIDNAVIELFRLAKTHSGDYDGWETPAISK
jgi:regulator of RNase E activity RraB